MCKTKLGLGQYQETIIVWKRKKEDKFQVHWIYLLGLFDTSFDKKMYRATISFIPKSILSLLFQYELNKKYYCYVLPCKVSTYPLFLEQKLFCINFYTVITAPHIYFWHQYRYYLNMEKKILCILLFVLLRFIPQLGTLYKIALSYFTNQYRIE